MNLSHFFIVIAVNCLIKFVNLQYTTCVNPQNFRGLCIPLQSCGYVVNILRYYSQNNEAQVFLRRSICGVDGNNQQYVCCPQSQGQQQQQAQDRNYNNRTPQNIQQQQQQQVQGGGNQFQQQQQTFSGGKQFQQQSQTGGNLQQQQQQIIKSLLPKCGFDIDTRIFGGVKSSINDFGWLALLRYARGSSLPVFKCAGSLINQRYIVTAAHCVHPALLQNVKLIGARLGEWNLLLNEDCESINGRRICAPNSIDVPFQEVILHEKYSPKSLHQQNDIALIRLTHPVQFNDFVKPICLQQNRNLKITDILGQSLVVAGFGATENAQNSNTKLHVSINVVENEVCNKIFKAEGRRLSNNSQICAGGVLNQDSCRGDSGGPLMKLVNRNQELTWVLYGIVSYGAHPCGQNNVPGVYTKVDQYIDWIESKLKP